MNDRIQPALWRRPVHRRAVGAAAGQRRQLLLLPVGDLRRRAGRVPAPAEQPDADRGRRRGADRADGRAVGGVIATILSIPIPATGRARSAGHVDGTASWPATRTSRLKRATPSSGSGRASGRRRHRSSACGHRVRSTSCSALIGGLLGVASFKKRRRRPARSKSAAAGVAAPGAGRQTRRPAAIRTRSAREQAPMSEIDALLQEDRRFPPSDEFQRARGRHRSRHLRAGGARSGSVLGRVRRRARMDRAVEAGARVEAAAREVVRRRQAQRQRQLPRPPRPRAAPQQGRARSGRASPAIAGR